MAKGNIEVSYALDKLYEARTGADFKIISRGDEKDKKGGG